jgi:hypothetical protein
MIYLANYIKVDAHVAGEILPMSISFHAKEETLHVLYIPYPNPFLYG